MAAREAPRLNLVPVTLSLVLVLAAPLALTATTLVREPAGGEADAPWQQREPCKFGRVDAPGASVLYAEDFEAGSGGWTPYTSVPRPNLWHWTTYAGNNSAMDAYGHGGPGRWYYGIENAFGGTFNTDPIENRGEIRSPPIDIPAGSQVVAVNVNDKWHVEWDRPWRYDAMEFGYIVNGVRTLVCWFGPIEGEWTQPGIGYYANSPTGSALITGCKFHPNHFPLCHPQTALGQALQFDLAPQTTLWEPRSILLPSSLAGQTVQLLFYFQEGDALINDAMGWMVDDVEVVRVV